MAVSVNQPRQKEKEEDPLDTIMKGLQIAGSVYGIVDATKKRDLLAKQNSLNEDRQAAQDERDSQRLGLEKQRLDQGASSDQERLAFDKWKASQEIAIKNKEGKDPFKRLPEDQKHVITDLSKKNATKIAIANQIDAVMGNWDNLAEDQKIASGRTLLKTLNSAEGADAIGTEEAKRLGSKLEFAMGNIFNSNPIQFGRDLTGFATQAREQSNALKSAIGSNQSIINDAYGDPGRETAIGNAISKKSDAGIDSKELTIQEKAAKALIRKQGMSSALKKSGGG